MAELAYQTWERVTGKPWAEASKGGFTKGSAQENLALQSKLQGGWNPFAAASPVAPAPAAPATSAFPTRNDYNTESNAAAQGRLDLVGQQNSQMDALAKGQESSADMYKRLSEQYGLPDIAKTVQGYKDQIYGIQGTLANLEDNVNDRTKAYKVNEAQRSRILTSEQNPLQKNLANLGIAMAPASDALTAAQSNVTQQMSFGQHDQDKAIQLMSDKFARESTGYTEAKQIKLSGLLSTIERGEQLSDMEHNEAVALAKAEADFEKQKELARISLAGSGGGNGGGNPYLNTPTATPASTSTSTISPQTNASRAGNTDNINFSYNGKNYSGKSREDYASVVSQTSDRNSSSWQQAHAQILKQFPDYQKNTGVYISPTSLFGMGG